MQTEAMEATAARGRQAGTPPVRILEGQAGSEAAAAAMRAYLAELSDRLDADPTLTHAADPADVTPPRGDFVLVREVASSDVVGFGAVHVLEPGVVEIKRMWLRPDVRGRGLMIGFDVPGELKDLKKNLLINQKIFTGEAKPNVIRLLPSLALKKRDAEQFIDSIKEEIEELVSIAE